MSGIGTSAPEAAIAAALLVLATCSPSGAATRTATPKDAAPRPRVTLPSGAVITLDLALTDTQKSQGLMFRPSMPKDAGMVFVFDSLEVRPFWMKNCHFPLDMIYTTKDGTVVDVLRDVPPCKADPCPSYPPKAKSDTVVEVNAGVAPANGVVPGAKLKFQDVPER